MYSSTESALLAYSPSQISQAYGFNQISFGGVTGNGAGQTIALIDAYNDPDFVNSTDPNFPSSTCTNLISRSASPTRQALPK